MSKKYFKCEPGKLCKAATCCRSMETQPSLSVGDYLRLSEYTGEPITQIWRNRGNISLSHFKDSNENEFLITLGLLHDPCTYLSNENKCNVHEVRPLGCASFPLLLYMFEKQQLKQNYSGYKCLEGVKPQPKQIKLGYELMNFMKKEAIFDEKHFWSDTLHYVQAPTTGDYSQLSLQAVEIQVGRDPGFKSKRSKRLARAINETSSLVENGEMQNGMKSDLYAHLLSPVMFAILEDEIAEKLDSLDEEVLRFYNETSEEWKELIKKIR